MYRVGEVTKVRIQQARREIGGGDGVCGQRSVLGFNLNKLMNGLRSDESRTGRVIRCGLLQGKPPEAGFGSPRKPMLAASVKCARQCPNFRQALV